MQTKDNDNVHNDYLVSSKKQLNKVKGYLGEQLAVDYLTRQGFVILDTNWQCKIGELDIVTKIDDCLVIVEVRSRQSDKYGSGLESVGISKQRQIARTTAVYIKIKKMYDTSVRFDVIQVDDQNQIVHIQDAFYCNIRI